jgi:hypothetical protein
VVAVPGEGLERLVEVSVVAGGADRDAGANGRVQVARVALPLLERVALEEALVEIAADLGQNDFLRVAGGCKGDADAGR